MPSTVSSLEEFVFHSDTYSRELITRRLAHVEVAKFLQARIDRTTSLVPLQQAEKLADFYDLQEVAPHLEHLLDRREANVEELQRSIVKTRIVARVGMPPDCDFARKYFLYLVQRADSTVLLDGLVSVYEALGSAGDATPLTVALTRRLQAVEPQAKTKPDLKHESQQLERLANFTLPRVTQANKVKDKVRSIRNRPDRIKEEIDIYLGLKPGYPEILPAWAARMLRREVWGDQPEQQVVRADDGGRRGELAQAFRVAFDRVRANADMPQGQKDFLVRSCLRAIEFFGGTLSDEQRVIVNQPGRQFYVLSHE